MTEFSEQARGTDIKGVCVLAIIVEADGSTSHISVTKGLRKDIDEKAVEVVKKWKFKPGLLKGKPVSVQINVELSTA